MNEYRRSPRKSAFVTIPVTNKMTGQIIGRIGNLSADGMLLVCDENIAEGALFQLGFELVNGHGHPQTIEVGVQEMWAENANVPGQYWAGFHFIDISDRDLETIESWLGDLKD
ncbi:MAG: PilZ domain-containing protein [Dokdonella sp.]|uniref:PilZ domain-containing protein n=1 Tax=Dokdonella sp. TaxID=2291710 RepID=UPI002D1A0A08|nr:PilZ domain-containing protein [Dokdonella sp.]HOX70520.1 PilZ domain-containing protein [Dokdonella sp.]HPG93357.1 PilZ domain-containing protein [Dokdonella sp.]HPN78257.1 PilZ domain-containing protein [Dokdonella sp.]